MWSGTDGNYPCMGYVNSNICNWICGERDSDRSRNQGDREER